MHNGAVLVGVVIVADILVAVRDKVLIAADNLARLRHLRRREVQPLAQELLRLLFRLRRNAPELGKRAKLDDAAAGVVAEVMPCVLCQRHGGRVVPSAPNSGASAVTDFDAQDFGGESCAVARFLYLLERIEFHTSLEAPE